MEDRGHHRESAHETSSSIVVDDLNVARSCGGPLEPESPESPESVDERAVGAEWIVLLPGNRRDQWERWIGSCNPSDDSLGPDRFDAVRDSCSGAAPATSAPPTRKADHLLAVADSRSS